MPNTDHTDTRPAAAAGYLTPAGPDEAWVLRYWFAQDHQSWLYGDPVDAIRQLADIARDRWHTVAGRRFGGGYAAPATPPEHDQAVVNLYFSALSGGREGYWLYRQDINRYRRDDNTSTTPGGEYILRGPGGGLLCACGNDATEAGFETCTRRGDVVDPDHDGLWDGTHYRCMTCDRVIALPDGRVTGRAGSIA
ncbi:MAG: hypothetical protein V7603_5044 [Micromonosporaceae bacterium]